MNRTRHSTERFVWLQDISVEQVRNLHNQTIRLSPGLNLFSGANAQGKTNFLEAVGLICLARSFRSSPNPDIIGFGQGHAAVTANLAESDPEVRSVRRLRIALDRRHKYAYVDGQKYTQLAEYLSHSLPAVIYRNDSLEIGSGGPGNRRRFLDQLIVGSDPPFLDVLRRYQKALAQRNKALKDRWQNNEMIGFERELARTGMLLLERRKKVTVELSAQAANFQRGFDETLDVQYRDSLQLESSSSQDQMETLYLDRLEKERLQDRRQGFTRRGPHRDDLEILLDEKPLRRFGSQGQVRSAVLSLKLAEFELLTRSRGIRPVLILDDVSVDMDEQRRQWLFEYISQDLQSIVSTTQSDSSGVKARRLRRFFVAQGKIESEGD